MTKAESKELRALREEVRKLREEIAKMCEAQKASVSLKWYPPRAEWQPDWPLNGTLCNAEPIYGEPFNRPEECVYSPVEGTVNS